jgi:hypothetical protein
MSVPIEVRFKYTEDEYVAAIREYLLKGPDDERSL